MKKFDIKILTDHFEIYNDLPMQGGELFIGVYKEFFLMRVDYWTLDQYRQQWREGVERLKTHDASCLVESAFIYEEGFGFGMFVLYKVKDTVFIQCHAPVMKVDDNEKAKKAINDTKNCYKLVRPRIANEKGEGLTEDGQPLWEKKISLKDFMESLPITA